MPLDPSETKYWVGFSSVPGVGKVRIALLEREFGSLSRAWLAPAEALRRSQLDRKTVEAILRRRNTTDLDLAMDRLARHNIKALTWHDPQYPALLREIADLPSVLFVRGELLPEDDVSVAVVGTRRASTYGREAAHHLVSGLARSRVTVISGLARGIDTVAHRTALEMGGRTVAVLACGLDMVYPGENAGLALEISQHGALVSEYPLGIKPEAAHFPRRNRIMAGMSLGVLVVEAGEESGANVTARLAMEENREIFAVPGSIFTPGSKGTHRWIQEGAKLVTRPEDILEELNLAVLGQQLELPVPSYGTLSSPVRVSGNLSAAVAASAVEQLLLRQLSREPVHIDVVGRMSGLPIAEVSSALAMMELRGLVRQTGGMHFVLA